MAMPRSLAPLAPLLLLLVSSAPVVRPGSPFSDNLQDACNKTLFPKVCIQSLTTNPETRTANARRLAELSVYVAKEVGTTVAAFAHHELYGVKQEDTLYKCLDSCSDDIEEAVAHLSALTRELTDAKFLEVKSWLSATLGGTSTCEEGCRDAPISEVKNAVVTKSLEFEKLLRVTLDLITEASGSMSAEVAVPPAAWDASAPGSYGSYGASAPGSYGAGAPETYDAAAPGSYGSGAPGSEAPSPGAPASSYGSSGSAADVPSPSSSIASAPSSGAADAPSYGAAGTPSSEAAGAPSSGAADAPSSGAADAPSYGAASAPSSGVADAPSSGAADAPSYGAAVGPSAGAADGPSSDAAGAPSYGAAAGAPSSGDAAALSSGDAAAPSPSSGASSPEADTTA